MPVAAKKPASRRLQSLKVSDAFRTFVLDQLDELGDVVPRAMFGGVGLYCRGVFFGIMARDVLYLKVDDRNRADYERAGMDPFKPYPGPQSGTMQYYAVPLEVLENAGDLAQWARKAVGVATASEGRRVTRRTQRPTRRREG
jgi:DNA transformation protein